MGLTSSHHFLSIHVTPYNTGKSSRISPNRFFCIGFRQPHNVAICFETTNDAKTASGMCISPVTCHKKVKTPNIIYFQVYTLHEILLFLKLKNRL